MRGVSVTKRSGLRILPHAGLVIVVLCVLMSLMLAFRPEAASVQKNFKMRVGQKVRLKLKGVNEPLQWTVISGQNLIKLKKNGVVKAKRTGKAVIAVEYDGVTYRFRAKIRVKKKKQSKVVRTIEQYVPPRKFQENTMILIGDSRFMGMKSVVGGKAAWICQQGEGLVWLKEKVIPKLNKMDVKGKAIVFNLGVNDLWEASSYISTLRSLGDKLKGRLARVYFMTVNPVQDKKANKNKYLVKNEQVTQFNSTVTRGLTGFEIIDSYDYLVKNSFNTVDGVHYDADTYRKIYAVLCSFVCA